MRLDVLRREIDERAIALAQVREPGLEEHGPAIRKVHAAILARVGCGIARVYTRLGGDQVGPGGIADGSRLVMPDPRQGIHVHVCQALHGANERKLVARDLARSLEGGCRER